MLWKKQWGRKTCFQGTESLEVLGYGRNFVAAGVGYIRARSRHLCFQMCKESVVQTLIMNSVLCFLSFP